MPEPTTIGEPPPPRPDDRDQGAEGRRPADRGGLGGELGRRPSPRPFRSRRAGPRRLWQRPLRKGQYRRRAPRPARPSAGGRGRRGGSARRGGLVRPDGRGRAPGCGRRRSRSTAGAPGSSVVRPAARRSIACWITASFSASTEDNASSRIRIGASRSSARAIASRWRWPPDSMTPRSPIIVCIALRQRRDELVRVGVARRGVELRLIGIGLAEPQILLDRAVEQVGVLVHDGDHPAHRFGVERRQIAPADQHACPAAGRTGAAAGARPRICPSRSGRRCRSSRRRRR